MAFLTSEVPIPKDNDLAPSDLAAQYSSFVAEAEHPRINGAFPLESFLFPPDHREVTTWKQRRLDVAEGKAAQLVSNRSRDKASGKFLFEADYLHAFREFCPRATWPPSSEMFEEHCECHTIIEHLPHRAKECAIFWRLRRAEGAKRGRETCERMVDFNMCLEWQPHVSWNVGCFVSKLRPFLIERLRDATGKEARASHGVRPCDVPDAGNFWTNHAQCHAHALDEQGQW